MAEPIYRDDVEALHAAWWAIQHCGEDCDPLCDQCRKHDEICGAIDRAIARLKVDRDKEQP